MKIKETASGFGKFLLTILKWVLLVLFVMITIFLLVFLTDGKLYIELIIVYVIIMILVLWKIWYNLSKKKALKNYDLENGKTKKSEKTSFIGGDSEEEPGIDNPDASDGRQGKIEPRGSLPTTSPVRHPKNSSCIRG